MKKLTFVMILFTAFSSLQATEIQHPFDSVMTIMKDASIPLLERYYMTATIDIFSPAQQVEILKTLIPEAKTYDDKAVITRLYSVIAHSLISLEKMHEAKNYLDSAFVYKDKFDNNAVSGLMYYMKGLYSHEVNDTKQAHENYYICAEYLQKLPVHPPLLTSIYYNLARIYVLWGDENRLIELVDEMAKIPYTFPEQHLLNNSVITDVFVVRYEKYNQAALLDSIIKYNLLGIELCNENTEKEVPSLQYQLSENYISLSKAYLQKGDTENARKNIELAEKYANKERWLVITQLNILKGQLYVAVREFEKAEEALNAAAEQLKMLKENQQIDYYHFYIDIYEQLAYIYEERKMYEKALTYEKASLEYRKRLFDKENTQIVYNLRARYNVEQQERIVNQLTLLSERRKNMNILIIVILVLSLLLLLLLIVRFRIVRRENENKLKIEEMKRKEGELQIELYKSRQEEKEHEFEIMQSEMQQRRMQSYLEGLEAAREKLSKELHDNISNELVALKMRVLKSEKPEQIIARLEQIHAEVRVVSHELMPPIFQHGGFTEVLLDYVCQRNELESVQMYLDFEPADTSWDDLPEEINLGLYRIIQETAGNALKHAEANQVTILLNRKADTISLVTQDDGKGFDTEKKHSGIGLKLIKDRAEGLNGQGYIHSVPGEGTRIEVVIKL